MLQKYQGGHPAYPVKRYEEPTEDKSNTTEKPPKSLPDDGSAVTYMGHKLQKHDSFQIGYRPPRINTKKHTITHVSRKHNGVLHTDPEGYERIHDNLKQAIVRIHDYEGVSR